jgi:leucine-rich repeat protein SHOC2
VSADTPIEDSSNPRIYVFRASRTYGPYSLEKARAYLGDGNLRPNDHASLAGGEGEWKELGELLEELTEPKERVESESMKKKILELLDREETGFAFDLVKGADDPTLYASLLAGTKVEDGILCGPDWVGWEGYRKSFFLRLMEAAPDSAGMRELCEGVRSLELRFFGHEEFPREVLQCENLEYLHLRGGKIESIPPEISKLKGLKDLYLEDIGLKRLPAELKDLKVLRRLDLPGNELSGPDANLEALGELETLEVLLLSYNGLPGLPSGVLAKLGKLRSLTLNGNELSQEGLDQMLGELAGLPELREIFLSRCEIERFPESLDGFEQLIKIDLAENRLEELPVWLGELASLKWIDLNGNPFYFEMHKDTESSVEAREEPDFSFITGMTGRASECEDAQWVEGFTTELTEESLDKLSWFKEVIKELQADHEQERMDEVLEELVAHGDPELLVEIVRGCTLEKEGIFLTGEHFPFPYWAMETFSCSSVEEDPENLWEGTGWMNDPKSVEAAPCHYFLLRILPNLPQDDRIHPSLRMNRIRALDLALPGIVPAEIGRYQELLELNLARNKLTSLPDELGDLPNLRILQLDKNDFESIPACVCRLESLTYLGLHRNNLKNLPEQIEGLQNLKVLDLSANQLNALPMEIANLGNLQVLGLKDNELESLPPEMWTLHELRQLWLGDNKLMDLPEELYSMDELVTVGLCGNLCYPENLEWVLGRSVFVSSSSRDLMLLKAKDETLKAEILNKVEVWNWEDE